MHRCAKILQCLIVMILSSLPALNETSFAGPVGRVDLQSLRTPIYTVDGDAFVRHNGDRYRNRPLYCNHLFAVVIAGDKPLALLGDAKLTCGCLMLGLVRGGKGKWLTDASDITSKYRPGRMSWTVRDASWGRTTLRFDVVPTATGAGMAARFHVDGAMPGDKLIWASGGASEGKESVLWRYDMTTVGRDAQMRPGFAPADCAGNTVAVENGGWSLQFPTSKGERVAHGKCSAASAISIGNAAEFTDPAALIASQGAATPIACASVPLEQTQDVFWTLRGPESVPASDVALSPAREFDAGMHRVLSVENQVVVKTPDAWLNAAVGASCIVTDAVFRSGMYTHSGMRWGQPLLGWRTIFGGTAYGWHDNVKADASRCIAKQVTVSTRTVAHADPATLLSSQAPDSRLFGLGRINIYQPYHYDMQSQFFDQIQHAWRWTGDPELETLLRPSLDLHCTYIHDCFDPENLGIYESYANTWPTDDQWYNGGGTSEETAYAYRAEQTALLLARRAGDAAGARRHREAIDRIRKGFFDRLWIPERGHPGAYREQGGFKRLHESPWLYGIFCPIDAGLLNPEQSAEALQYTEWGLERIALPYGGEQCWPSNWVPSIWSVREMWPGDNYQLALAYFQTGLADDGWEVLRGTFPQMLLFGPVPGDLGHPAGGTDFNDCASMFSRTVVEGLFGYAPDYPAGTVRIAPQFPFDWKTASIRTPDMSLVYARQGVATTLQVTVAKAADLDIRLPLSTTGIQRVRVNGMPAKWEQIPGFGRTILRIVVPRASAAKIEIVCRDARPRLPKVHVEGNSGKRITLRAAADAESIVDFHDPQGALTQARVVGGALTGIVTKNVGNHLIFLLTRCGETRQWQLCDVKITDTDAEAARKAKKLQAVPQNAAWTPVDLAPVLNGDIREIYKQKYLTPRPQTCSLRLATDGYSTWQMVLNPKNHVPDIDLTNVPTLLDPSGQLKTKSGAVFHWPTGSANIAFVSLWDNWPKRVTIPVNQAGEAVSFLICGTTNPMEVRIANAALRLEYTDGVTETIDVIPPFNFWSLCPIDNFDYNYGRDAFALPESPPTTVQLGVNCRAVVLTTRLRRGVRLKSVTLEALSEQVVIGVMGISLMHQNPIR